MIYKTLEDVQRVIEKQKPAAVIDMFIESYLMGEALAPYFEIEEEYQELLNQEDAPDVAPVVDPETLEVITEGYSSNDIRDARILELETQYSYLVAPEPDADGIVPTLGERRPVSDLDIDLARQAKLMQIKARSKAALPTGRVTLSIGWPIDCRRSARHDDVGNMERLLRLCQAAGMADSTKVTIRGADNANHEVTVAQLRDIVIQEMYQYGQGLYQHKWELEAQANAAATAADVLAVRWGIVAK
jgi:hypothetical protein